MTPQRAAWALLIGAPVAVEFTALAVGRSDWTLSPQLRWALRTTTPRGATFSALAIGAGSAWLAHHLSTTPAPQED